MYQKHTYPNGLKLLTIPMKSTRAVTVLVLVGTGSKYETKDINGVSHFLEHMMFKGTEKRPNAIDIAKTLDGIGADYNAFTSKEFTGYYAKASIENTDTILDLISDIFQNSKIADEEIQRERHVVVEEINMYNDVPAQYVGILFDKLLYGDQPAGWSVAGEKETILGLKRETFVEYFNTHYFAGNTVVAIAGDIEPDDTKEKVEKAFSSVREHEELKKLPVKEEQSEPKLVVQYKETDQTNFILGNRAYDLFNPRKPALALLSIILGSGMSSRLFIEVRERRGLGYRISSGADALTDHGIFGTSAGVNNEKAIEAIKVILEEYKKIKTELVPEDELEKAKNAINGSLAIELERTNAMAGWYANQELLEKKTLTPEEKLEKINKVTAEEIMEVANDIFKNENLNLALIGPFKDNSEFKKILNL